MQKGMETIMLKQVAIFAENKKGTFQDITQILQNANINILGSVTNDGPEYGIMRLIVSDTEKALASLKEGGYLCRSNDVIGVELEDKVGNLNQLLLSLEAGNINVDYIYLCFNRDTGKPVLILHTNEIFEVEEYLKGKGFILLKVELYQNIRRSKLIPDESVTSLSGVHLGFYFSFRLL